VKGSRVEVQNDRAARRRVTLPFAGSKRFWDFNVWPKTGFFDREWTTKDKTVAGVFLFIHAGCLLAPFYCTPSAVLAGLVCYILTGLGITFSYHRNLTHRAFVLPKPLEYFFAWLGACALQGDPAEWVSAHRHHHAACDGERDPHSPFDGFFWAHMGWMMHEKGAPVLADRSNVADLLKQPFYRFLRATYPFHPLVPAVLLYAIGGLPWLVWGGFVRIAALYHVTWFVNSASHVWGFQSFKTGDISMNNPAVALLAFGEGWHNNHHAFEDSARHGLLWWQIDVTWYLVWVLQKLGLATKVRLPKQSQMDALAI